MFFGPSVFQLRGEVDKKTSSDRSEINQKIDPNLDAIFSRFLNQLGSILGGFWPPSWSQVGTKWHQNPTPKPIKKMIAFWKGSGAILGGFWPPTWGVQGGSASVVFEGLLALGALLGPRWPKEPPKRNQDASNTDLGASLVDFLLIFD